MIFRFPEPRDESTLRHAHQELGLEGANFLLDAYESFMNFETYIQRVNDSAKGTNLLAGRVQSTFLILEISGEIVGRVSIRHELNDWLATFGGHIGYAVRPAFRRKGYGKLLLREGLDVCARLDISQALLTCNESNVASRKVIESFGGEFINTIPDGDQILRRYLVPTS